MAAPVSRFLAWNRRLSRRLEPRVEATEPFYEEYDERVLAAARGLSAPPVIVDLGGGRSCSFAAAVDRRGGTRIVAVDISAAELSENRDVDETRVADVAAGLPFADGEVGLLVSRTLLEHVEGVPAAVRNIGRAVGPGGRTIHLVPCRSSLFALAGRIVPWRIAKPLLDLLVPGARGVVEFEPFYDHCEPRTLERLFREAGFDDVRVSVSWSQADYFQSLFPVYALVCAYQALLRRFGIRRLAAYAIVDAAKR